MRPLTLFVALLLHGEMIHRASPADTQGNETKAKNWWGGYVIDGANLLGVVITWTIFHWLGFSLAGALLAAMLTSLGSYGLGRLNIRIFWRVLAAAAFAVIVTGMQFELSQALTQLILRVSSKT